ncbi:hypothetical protein [Mesorhizobium sp. M00.F.Ca.ET.216.01.1.1]|uniref:hypothetical protein n=1 Tax=Mesorhizobium sp. M00.F.Ca.ET.216.01.1.1 TaxID=2500528 RepID=UPI000FDCDAFF|nr:hypothetical protein [Mesorhizobium sp. M00.F.Ca.ET.216.01.1.1]TGQ38478.1 hypothetical protein EN859_018590 [Mesorhizobium sp. M00.F.Ca.ET.216.01.1.1]TJW05631.1 MAG: hypothetical protein E5W82_28390 [Mesorhizobium sp.]
MKAEWFWLSVIATGVLASAYLAVPAAAQEQRGAATIVAAKVRSQGFACNKPSSAKRIAAESAPNMPVYLLSCDVVTYHVVLIPDQAAIVVTKAE